MFYACLFIWNCLYIIHELQFYTSWFRIRRILFSWTWTIHITSWTRECWQTIYCWNFDHSWLGDWCRMVFTFIVHFSKLAICSNDEFHLGFVMFTYLLFLHTWISKESFPNISYFQICNVYLKTNARWLWRQGRRKEAIEVLRWMARINQRSIDGKMLDSLEQQDRLFIYNILNQYYSTCHIRFASNSS